MSRLVVRVVAALLLTTTASVRAQTPAVANQFFHSGDGVLDLASTHATASFSGTFRLPDGNYDAAALRKINTVFGTSLDRPAARVELRLIEFLDYLQDELHGGQITIVSGYRSPAYNEALRERGRLAGKASLHQYGMAADIRMAHVSAKRLWTFVRELGFGGVGYYHGGSVHIDTGPTRFWDERTSKVGTDIADDNKLIMLVADRDIYCAGDEIELRFARMTAWPIGVRPTFSLERKVGEKWKGVETLVPMGRVEVDPSCVTHASTEDMTGLRVTLPARLPPGRYRIGARFCNRTWPAMPQEIWTAEFEVTPHNL